MGSDCAVLTVPAATQLVSIDTHVQGVHFDPDFLSWREIGYRSMATSLSDLAAGGADPGAPIIAFLSLAFPDAVADAELRGLEDGLADAFDEFHVSLAGGDTVSTPGPLVLTVALIGQTQTPLTRKGARPGHRVMVAGRLGGAGAALSLLRLNRPAKDEALLAAYRRPKPLLDFGFFLARSGVGACADISDGLLADAGHIAGQSGVAMDLDLDRLPLQQELENHPLFNDEERVRLGATHGDDYALVFTVSPSRVEGIVREAKKIGLSLTELGVCTEGPAGEIRATWRNRRYRPERLGYEH